MSDTRKRMIILAVTVIAVMALLVVGVVACSGGPLARNEPSATPTKTPKPTFTATPIPTDTPLPTDTPTPTDTATPTPLPTNTPIVYTATPTPEPTETETPIPSPTATRRPPTRVPPPKPTATRALPTNTPVPQFQWDGELIWNPTIAPNCAGIGISRMSIIKDKSGAVINGARVLMDCYGNQFISVASGTAGVYDPGHYDFWGLTTQPVAYVCTLRMYDLNGQPIQSSEVITVQFDTATCTPGGSGHQVAIVNWTKKY